VPGRRHRCSQHRCGDRHVTCTENIGNVASAERAAGRKVERAANSPDQRQAKGLGNVVRMDDRQRRPRV
jgi:hypothetical protein